jgi:predicted dehydrogenase
MTGAGLHALDACIGLFGPVRRVTARLMEHPPAPAPRDSISVILEFANGTSGMMATLRATPFFWRVHVFGTEGSAEVLGETEMVVRRANAAPERITFPARGFAARRARRLRRPSGARRSPGHRRARRAGHHDRLRGRGKVARCRNPDRLR